jgi:hypothetical protein
MPIKQAKKLTTNSIIYLTLSALVAGYGLHKASMVHLAFAMWMIQIAHFFKKTKKRHKNSTDTEVVCTEVVNIGGCDACS